jgi:hypothetical protein
MQSAHTVPDIGLPNRLIPRPQVVSARHGDSTVLLNAATGHYYTLNHTGARIWEWICDGVRPPEIVGRLQAEYGVTATVAREDLGTLLNRCAAECLFEVE